MGVQFDRSTIDGEIATLQALVDQVKEKKGNAAQRLADATLEALGHDVSDQEIPVITDTDGKVMLGDVAIWAKAVYDWAEQLANETVQGIVRKAGNVDNVDALVAQYQSAKVKVEAMLTLAEPFGVDITGVEIPTMRGGSSAGSQSRPRRASTTKQQVFYRLLPDGTRRDQSENQNSLSSMAWYYGGKITGAPDRNNDRGCGARQLEDFLSANIDGFSMGKPWTFSVDGTTYGMDVLTPGPVATAGEEE